MELIWNQIKTINSDSIEYLINSILIWIES